MLYGLNGKEKQMPHHAKVTITKKNSQFENVIKNS